MALPFRYCCTISTILKINDGFGYQRGDDVLIRFASILKNAHNVDYVFRLGGEEFATIASHCNCSQA